MAQTRDKEVPIGPHTTVRDAVQRYTGIDAVFDRHGLLGCGGPDGPVEPIAFFARVHQVDPAALLRELNEFAARRDGAAPVMEKRPSQAAQPYFIAVSVSLAMAALGGFPLGILAALGGGRDVGLGTRWVPLIQAHGHLQLVGFVGLFVVGMAYHVLPRFKNTALAFPRLALPSIGLLAIGAALRAATQPWADSSAIAALFVVSALLELSGACAFAAVVGGTLRNAQRKNYDRYLLSGAAWFAAASVANLAVVYAAARDGQPVIAATRNAPLLEMYLFGFITMFVLGVSVRVLPHFLSLRPPTVRNFMPALAMINAGVAALVVAGWAEALGSWSRPDWVTALGVYLIAAGLVVFILGLNLHRRSLRDETSDVPGGHERLIRTAYVWLCVAMAIEVWYATKGVAGDFRPDFLESGAARHALALGFMTQMIFGVGSRALPAFAGKKLYSQRLVAVAWIIINLSVAMRVGHAAIPWGSVTFRFDHIAAAGALGMCALIVFGFNIVRTIRPPRRATKRERARYEVSTGSVIAESLERVPGSLE